MAGHRPDWVRAIPFIILHLGCFLVIWVGWSWPAVITAVVLYVVRMFGITGFYHRYFSHRTFQCPRWVAAAGAVLGAASAQRGPLWWAAHHRHHHRHSDHDPDKHSPVKQGFWHSHVLWFLCPDNFATDKKEVKDLADRIELRFLDRFDWTIPIMLGVGCWLLGWWWQQYDPTTGPWQLLVWGFFVSTICCHHGTFTINSLAHRWGSRPYKTTDDSRNNLFLALITLGEGWHNNHHRYAASARQGFRWFQIDITFWILTMMSWVGLVSKIKPVPQKIIDEAGTA
ncbi:MAG: acyl-CoA desaturase [Sphaerospermopsis sp. SIO1G2]|nr:acyl-CoA desaturase [Sphaerospermopsis sp. SIO1G2]